MDTKSVKAQIHDEIGNLDREMTRLRDEIIRLEARKGKFKEAFEAIVAAEEQAGKLLLIMDFSEVEEDPGFDEVTVQPSLDQTDHSDPPVVGAEYPEAVQDPVVADEPVAAEVVAFNGAPSVEMEEEFAEAELVEAAAELGEHADDRLEMLFNDKKSSENGDSSYDVPNFLRNYL